jgi:hypothetical protein
MRHEERIGDERRAEKRKGGRGTGKERRRVTQGRGRDEG